jgi:hypothetical protein
MRHEQIVSSELRLELLGSCLHASFLIQSRMCRKVILGSCAGKHSECTFLKGGRKMKRAKKFFTTSAIALSLLGVGASVVTVVQAGTVYYKGYAVEWDHYRNWGAWGYSLVQTSRFHHSTTVNGHYSGLKNPGTAASENPFIGNATEEAYWYAQ